MFGELAEKLECSRADVNCGFEGISGGEGNGQSNIMLFLRCLIAMDKGLI